MKRADAAEWARWSGAFLLSLACYPAEGLLWILGCAVVVTLAARRCWHFLPVYDTSKGPVRVLVRDGRNPTRPRFYHETLPGQPVVHLAQWRPEWAWLWGNEEDGIFGPVTSESPSTRRWIERWRAAPRTKEARVGWQRLFSLRWLQRHWLQLRAISWCALRNPVANLRFSRWGLTLSRPKIRFHGSKMPDGTPCTNPWEAYKDLRMPPLVLAADVRRATLVAAAMSGPPFWCAARQGWRAGLWVVWPLSRHRHRILRLAWKVYPGFTREIDRRVAMTAQLRWASKDPPEWEAAAGMPVA